MLVQITERCQMGCPHCMNNSSLDGQHMSEEIFKKVLDFIVKYDPVEIFITGGEPTEHPLFCEFVRVAKEKIKFIRVGSNGLFLYNKEYTEQILTLPIDQIEICNDQRFYPKKINKIEHERIVYIDNLTDVAKIGRS